MLCLHHDLNFWNQNRSKIEEGAPYMCANLRIAKLKPSSTLKLLDKFVKKNMRRWQKCCHFQN